MIAVVHVRVITVEICQCDRSLSISIDLLIVTSRLLMHPPTYGCMQQQCWFDPVAGEGEDRSLERAL